MKSMVSSLVWFNFFKMINLFNIFASEDDRQLLVCLYVAIDLFTITAAILNSIVLNNYYGMLRGQISMYLPPEHPIIDIWNNGIQNSRCIGKKVYSLVFVEKCPEDVEVDKLCKSAPPHPVRYPDDALIMCEITCTWAIGVVLAYLYITFLAFRSKHWMK